jgi:hypothetical protein
MTHDRNGIAVPGSPELELLDDSKEFDFYLTGSYYFGCARPDSDLDFVAQYSPELFKWLEANGFKSILSAHYNNSLMTRYVMERGNVQVQLARDVAEKCRVRDLVREHNADWHLTADRGQRTWLWNRWAEVLAPDIYGPSSLSLF